MPIHANSSLAQAGCLSTDSQPRTLGRGCPAFCCQLGRGASAWLALAAASSSSLGDRVRQSFIRTMATSPWISSSFHTLGVQPPNGKEQEIEDEPWLEVESVPLDKNKSSRRWLYSWLEGDLHGGLAGLPCADKPAKFVFLPRHPPPTAENLAFGVRVFLSRKFCFVPWLPIHQRGGHGRAGWLSVLPLCVLPLCLDCQACVSSWE